MRKFRDHLPECPLEITNEATQLGNPDWWGTIHWRKPDGTTVTTQLGTHCICDRLRKAEERAFREWVLEGAASDDWMTVAQVRRALEDAESTRRARSSEA